jgi:hypothetical protein
MASGEPVRSGCEERETAPALTMARCSPADVHGKGGHAAAGGLQHSRLWEFIQSGQPRTNALPTEAARDPARVIDEKPVGWRRTSSGRQRIINTPMGQALIAELNSIEVEHAR